MDLIEATFAQLGVVGRRRRCPPGAIRDLVADGIIGGIAGTVVFLPQICLLFFLISLLEDTGYLARAAFVMDRLLCRFGLPGHAFVPLLSRHACALPGIMSTRLIPGSPRSAGDDSRRAAHELLGAPAGLRAADQHAVRRTSRCSPALAFAGCYLLGALAALRQRARAPPHARARARRGRWCSSCRPTRCRRSPTRC